MSVKASTRQRGSVTVIDLSGQIKLGEGSSVLRDTVKDLLGKGYKKILLNLGDRNQGGELKLLHVTKKVRDVLQITRLYTLFHVLDDETEAIAAFNS